MNKLSEKKQILLGVLSIIVIIAILFFSFFSSLNGQNNTLTEMTSTILIETDITTPNETEQTTVISTEDPLNEFRKIMSETKNQITQQEDIDQNIISELESGVYTFTKPLIIVDPYNTSPLTALVVFTTSEPVNISILIHGQDKYTDISFTFKGYNMEHIIPVYGLYPGLDNDITLTSINQTGNINQVDLIIRTEPLPEELKSQIILTDAPI